MSNPDTAEASSRPGGERMSSGQVLIFGLDVSHLPRGCIFMVGSAGIFAFYLVYGLVQEYLFKISGFSEHFMAVTAYQFLLYAVISYIEGKISNVTYHENFPPWLYCSAGITTLGTILLSNAAVVYLNYPTQVICKCCKLIPVMVLGSVIQRKKYRWVDYFSVVCMIVGLIFFILTDVSVQPNFNPRGIIAISVALVCDGYVGNLQELAMKSYQIPALQVLTYSYSFGFVLLLVVLIVTRRLVPSIVFFYANMKATFLWIMLFVCSGYWGLQFVLLLVNHFGALLAVTMTTFRKALTIILSFVFFRKPFSMQYLWSGCLVTMGILLHNYSKSRKAGESVGAEAKQDNQSV